MVIRYGYHPKTVLSTLGSHLVFLHQTTQVEFCHQPDWSSLLQGGSTCTTTTTDFPSSGESFKATHRRLSLSWKTLVHSLYRDVESPPYQLVNANRGLVGANNQKNHLLVAHEALTLPHQ